MVTEKRAKRVKTVREGVPHLIDGVVVTVRRKRRHGGQYRVEVCPIDVPVDKRDCKPQ